MALFYSFLCWVIFMSTSCCDQIAKITQGPCSVNTILGSQEAVFTCAGANAYYFKWFIDGERENHPKSMERGIKYYNGYIDSVLKFSSLTIPATNTNKNSSIKCSLRSKQDEDGPTEAVFLMVQGYLTNVTNLQLTVNVSLCFTLKWEEPFSLPGVPILGYSVVVYSNTTVLVNDTTQETHYQYCSSEEAANGINMKVGGYNELGIGDYSSVAWEGAFIDTVTDPVVAISSTAAYLKSIVGSDSGHPLMFSSATAILAVINSATPPNSLVGIDIDAPLTSTITGTHVLPPSSLNGCDSVSLSKAANVAVAGSASECIYAYVGLSIVIFLNISLLVVVVISLAFCQRITKRARELQSKLRPAADTYQIEMQPNNAYEELPNRLPSR